jgi:hypothetical protein
MSTVATDIPELAVVEFTSEVGEHPRGAVGVVVSAHPEDDAYTVELVGADGETLDLVSVRSSDIRVSRLT